MARPQKNNADYFPHDNNMWSDRKIVALRNKFGLTGYAVWNLLLETLCESEDFEVISNESEVELLANFWGLDTDKLQEILSFMARIGLIKSDSGKIWSDKLKERLQPMLDERTRKRNWAQRVAQKRWDTDDKNPISDDENEILDGDNSATTEFSTATRMPKERKEKESKANESKETPSPEGDGKMTEKDFADFWDIYPKKREKQKAKDKFLWLKNELLPQIMKAVRLQKETFEWQKENGQFVPHPTTWINGKRWEDDINSFHFNNSNHGSIQGNRGRSGYVSTTGEADLIITDEDV